MPDVGIARMLGEAKSIECWWVDWFDSEYSEVELFLGLGLPTPPVGRAPVHAQLRDGGVDVRRRSDSGRLFDFRYTDEDVRKQMIIPGTNDIESHQPPAKRRRAFGSVSSSLSDADVDTTLENDDAEGDDAEGEEEDAGDFFIASIVHCPCIDDYNGAYDESDTADS
ncbi:hypothetical protein D9611_007952 [Ephemerocybe angulata]|uniref:Uncharacterized protein n=1 Tax=Ephemerocybe angulata TaxID=980116 RepID=A0A8H5FL07_9AGAR|nr:hypothetical protein D9611_007952 [Tulosesus angulatus]